MGTLENATVPGPGLERRRRAERRRERIASVVDDRDPPLPLAELADAVAARCDADPDALRVRLHHVHLPKLEARDVLAYDPERNVVGENESG